MARGGRHGGSKGQLKRAGQGGPAAPCTGERIGKRILGTLMHPGISLPALTFFLSTFGRLHASFSKSTGGCRLRRTCSEQPMGARQGRAQSADGAQGTGMCA